MTLKAIESFIATVDPKRATVVSFPEFIAIFGGAISPKKKNKAKSQRDAFVRWWTENRQEQVELLLLPENYSDWNEFNTYSDLLLFEKDLGYLTSAVLVFLEAPGAIAELGAFSQINSLSERLVVVVRDIHHPAKSFISLGPIRSLEKTQKHENSVCVIPNVKPEDLPKHISVVIATLDQKRAQTKPSSTFNAADAQHEIILVLDLVNLFLVCQITELQKILLHFGIEIKTARLDQILFLLQKTELISYRQYGNNHYYIPKKFRKIYVDYTTSKPGINFKRERFKTIIWKEIQSDAFRKSIFELENDGSKKS
ncbi:retron St85 family effector protein [Janthinobacterium kumbetense]|uniref:Retron St85 family effector protein n=1 Tax=Janthinobacterium kumbetense TaxID=2950280 RepID=A0ABT0WQF4_9BURK|nr:retron St85 family effector protein [Janthinobacterium kumbetense]MCM2566292.1 retron St85 family effector protein [Janthinobacterium kumbetense]